MSKISNTDRRKTQLFENLTKQLNGSMARRRKYTNLCLKRTLPLNKCNILKNPETNALPKDLQEGVYALYNSRLVINGLQIFANQIVWMLSRSLLSSLQTWEYYKEIFEISYQVDSGLLRTSSKLYREFLAYKQGDQIVTTCGNLGCINPQHLVIQTPKERINSLHLIPQDFGTFDMYLAVCKEVSDYLAEPITTQRWKPKSVVPTEGKTREFNMTLNNFVSKILNQGYTLPKLAPVVTVSKGLANLSQVDLKVDKAKLELHLKSAREEDIKERIIAQVDEFGVTQIQYRSTQQLYQGLAKQMCWVKAQLNKQEQLLNNHCKALNQHFSKAKIQVLKARESALFPKQGLDAVPYIDNHGNFQPSNTLIPEYDIYAQCARIVQRGLSPIENEVPITSEIYEGPEGCLSRLGRPFETFMPLITAGNDDQKEVTDLNDLEFIYAPLFPVDTSENYDSQWNLITDNANVDNEGRPRTTTKLEDYRGLWDLCPERNFDIEFFSQKRFNKKHHYIRGVEKSPEDPQKYAFERANALTLEGVYIVMSRAIKSIENIDYQLYEEVLATLPISKMTLIEYYSPTKLLVEATFMGHCGRINKVTVFQLGLDWYVQPD